MAGRRADSFKMAALYLAWSLLLFFGYQQLPLFSENQNHKFLHGLARAGFGDLHHDWMVHTADPTPLFTGLVAVSYAKLGSWSFYAEQFLLYFVYFIALVRLFLAIGGTRRPRGLLPCGFAAIVVALHSFALSDLSRASLGLDLRSLLQDGVAGQYLLGPYLQPSVFGVFLVLSIAAFVEEQPLRAVAFAAVASIMHFTYLISGLILVASYTLLWGRRNLRTAILLLPVFVGVNLPTILYTMAHFGPSSPETSRVAQDLMANHRFPHHCIVARWFDLGAEVKILWVLLAIYLTAGTKLAAVLSFSLVASAVLTAVQMITGSNTLALLFPWRPSVYLVPIATTVNVGKLLLALFERFEYGVAEKQRSWIVLALCLFFGINMAVLGAWETYDKWEKRGHSDFGRMTAFVREHRTPGQTYLIPIVPLSHELQQFRLCTGTPLYVDYKSHPYKDIEVIEWSNRVDNCKRLYEMWNRGGPTDTEDRDELRRIGVSHVVLLRPYGRLHDPNQILYENNGYIIINIYNLHQ